ncbi:potassium channel family protein [Piscinibacter sp. XHJ-5]|uniref:potassium channel family protein n=1 Tax=Piscinibacter sp. XHJ-5 TaxID=3037797 RepID=UPI002452DC58|nr:potassium channel family protein [Piscinibacter sp. XHJ-5]
MPTTIACAAALLLLTTLIHYEALRALDRIVPLLRWPGRSHIVLVIVALFCAHVVEIVLYAATYFLLLRHAALGSIGRSATLSINHALYFSFETFSTLGYGDIAPAGAIRLLAGTESLNGLLLIGWSSSYAHIAMQRAAGER